MQGTQKRTVQVEAGGTDPAHHGRQTDHHHGLCCRLSVGSGSQEDRSHLKQKTHLVCARMLVQDVVVYETRFVCERLCIKQLNFDIRTNSESLDWLKQPEIHSAFSAPFCVSMATSMWGDSTLMT